MYIGKREAAEFVGTFWLVLGGCGSAVLAAAFPKVGIGLVGVSFAFGLTVLTMAYAIGHVSGCHLNPAVTIGLAAAGRFARKDVAPYIAAQCLGAPGAQPRSRAVRRRMGRQAAVALLGRAHRRRGDRRNGLSLRR